MKITTLDRDSDDVAPTTNGARTAGFAHKAAAYCPECAADKTVEVNGEEMAMPDAAEVTGEGRHVVGLIQASAEWDAPGATCDNCLRRLDTRIIHYDDA